MPISIEVGEICLKGYAYYDQRREQQERNTLYKRLYDLMDRLKSITLKPWMNPVEVFKETARKDARFIEWQAIDETTIQQHLFTAGQPDPDLLIRTGGEHRLSNFLLWQASYAELYFTDIKWPDFRKAQFLAAIDDFSRRQRRFGKTGAQLKAP